MSQHVLLPETASAAGDVLALEAATITDEDRGNARLAMGADTAM